MKNIILRGILLIISFVFVWFIFSQINWTSILKVDKATEKTEEKLGELFWNVIKSNETVNKNPFVIQSVDSIVTRITTDNKINKNKLQVHIIESNEINAFALPNGHIIILTGLINASENPEELSGIISHEIAHLELNHVMKKLIKEFGLTAIISISSGNTGAEIIKEMTKLISSSAFDRSMEKEADLKAVEYLVNANINPESFADFLYKLSDKENKYSKYTTWISTHPESKKRATYIINEVDNKVIKSIPILSPNTWNRLKEETQIKIN